MKATTKKLIIKICDKIIKWAEKPTTTKTVKTVTRETVKKSAPTVQEVTKEIEKTEPVYSFKVGDILESSWGYEQTNVQFFQVVKATAKTIWFKEIKSEIVNWESSMSGQKMPMINNFKNDKVLMRRISTYFDGVSINSYSNAYRWDGKPEFFSSWA